MQGLNEQKQNIRLSDLSLEDRNRLVGAFVWLVREDMKQNPEFYQTTSNKEDD